MFNLCEETLSRVKEYLNLGILQMSRYGLNLKLEMCLLSDALLDIVNLPSRP